MIDWLLEKGVDFPPNALKDDLWQIIKEQLLLEPDYGIDKLLQRKRPDITIERLPPYHVRIYIVFRNLHLNTQNCLRHYVNKNFQ